MKLALCLAGLTNNYEESYPILKRKILDQYNPDIYLHGWESDMDRVGRIVDLYKPRDFILEPQRSFDKELSICHHLNNFYTKFSSYFTCSSLFKVFSQAYSRKTSFELINKKSYDCVIVARYDVYAFHGDTSLPEDFLNNVLFDPSLDFSYIYSSEWDQKNAGPNDTWFYSNLNNMKILCSMYDNLTLYYQPGSEYLRLLIGGDGWPDSNEYNEFSNEVDLSDDNKCKNLIKFLPNALFNNHYVYKYHFIHTGLYKKSRYIK